MVTAPPTLPNLDELHPNELKALIVAQHEALVARETEIENLKLLILKLWRMQFGCKSEKLGHQIQQLQLLRYVLAARLRPDDRNHLESRRHKLANFRYTFTQPAQRAAALRARRLPGFVRLRLAWQLVRQWAPC